MLVGIDQISTVHNTLQVGGVDSHLKFWDFAPIPTLCWCPALHCRKWGPHPLTSGAGSEPWCCWGTGCGQRPRLGERVSAEHFGLVSLFSNMEETYINTLNPEKLLWCAYDKNHQIRACRFPYQFIKCRKNHLDVANWRLVPSMLAVRFLGLKSVITSQAVMTKAVLSRV